MEAVAEEAPRAAGIERKERNFAALNDFVAREATKPFAVFAPVTLAESDHMRALRARCSAFPWMRDLGKTLRAVAAIARAQGLDPPAPRGLKPERAALVAGVKARARALRRPTPLSEPESKALLAAYGIVGPSERVVETPEAAAQAARAIGFPVVVKAVASAVPHKSDAGLVILDLRDAEGAVEAARVITQRCAALGVPLEGLLVARRIEGAVEMALGLHRDPELGPAVMVGMGGVWLELFQDAAFAPPTLDHAGARAAIARTRAATLLGGYRGGAAGDVDALADAMVALGAMAQELGDSLEAVDVNPLAVLPLGRGVVALDALVALRPPGANPDLNADAGATRAAPWGKRGCGRFLALRRRPRRSRARRRRSSTAARR